MKTFYRVHAQFFTKCKNKPLAGLKEYKKNEQPKDQREVKYGIIGFFIWTDNKIAAKQLVKQILEERISLQDMETVIYSQENEFFDKQAEAA